VAEILSTADFFGGSFQLKKAPRPRFFFSFFLFSCGARCPSALGTRTFWGPRSRAVLPDALFGSTGPDLKEVFSLLRRKIDPPSFSREFTAQGAFSGARGSFLSGSQRWNGARFLPLRRGEGPLLTKRTT